MAIPTTQKCLRIILVHIANNNERAYLEGLQEDLAKLTILIHDKLLQLPACHQLVDK